MRHLFTNSPDSTRKNIKTISVLLKQRHRGNVPVGGASLVDRGRVCNIPYGSGWWSRETPTRHWIVGTVHRQITSPRQYAEQPKLPMAMGS